MVYFFSQAGVLFSIEITEFLPVGQILAVLLCIYALFGVFFHSLTDMDFVKCFTPVISPIQFYLEKREERDFLRQKMRILVFDARKD